jgi:2-iminobutanoate/2-iminopropanoate deaminase
VFEEAPGRRVGCGAKLNIAAAVRPCSVPRKIIRTDGAPKPGGPYSQGIVAGNLVFVSGQDGRDPSTGKRPEGIEAQTRQTLINIGAILRKAGTSMENVVKTSVFLTTLNDFEAMNRVYVGFFAKDPPVRTTIQTAFRGDMLIEIDCIALVPETP